MRVRLVGIAWLGAALLVSIPVHGQVSSPYSASTLRPGSVGTAATVGFPYLSVQGTVGITRSFDLSLQARSAWSSVQRLGLGARYRLSGEGPSGFALRGLVDGWFSRPANTQWMDLTGEQDFTGDLQLLYSWSTTSNGILTIHTGLQLVGNRFARRPPLGGARPFLTIGSNAVLGLTAEVPHSSGVIFSVTLGGDIHLTGFDDGSVMPLFGLGLGYVL